MTAAPTHEVLDRARRDRRDLYNGVRLQAALERRGLDAVIASSAANVSYTGGTWVPHPLLLSFVVTSGTGGQAVVINEADEYYFDEYSWVDDIRGFRFGPSAAEDAFSLLRDVVDDLGLAEATLGIESSHLSQTVVTRLAEALPRATLVDAADVFEHARVVKTPGELELLALAAQYTDKAIQTAFALATPGETEKTLAARMQGIALALGADASGHTHVHAGTHSTVVHTLSIERPIVSGEVVHVDFGAMFAGYATDLSRNAVVEVPSPRQKEIYARLLEIERLLIAELRPGIRASRIFELGIAAFERHGLTHPWGTLGHSIGLTTHEGFEFSAGADDVLEPGMVVCVEPSHIERGDARYHIEDTVAITEGEPRVISDFAPIDELFTIR